MATNKTVRVTTIPTKTGDTVASYNVYSSSPSAGTLLGTMTTGEAAAGKVFSLTDGVVHSITVKAVWTTGGVSTLSSNAVSVDLSAPVSSVAAPTNFAYSTVGQDTVYVSWTNSVTAGVTHYRAYNNSTLISTMEKNHSLQFALCGLTPGTSYSNVTLRAWNGTEESVSSNSISFTTNSAEYVSEIPVTYTFSDNITNIGSAILSNITASTGVPRIAALEPVSGDGHFVATDHTAWHDCGIFVRPTNSTNIASAFPSYGIYAQSSAQKYYWYYYESSTLVGAATTISIAVGDKFRIVRTGTNLKAQVQRINTLTWIDLYNFGNSTQVASGYMYAIFNMFSANSEISSCKVLQ